MRPLNQCAQCGFSESVIRLSDSALDKPLFGVILLLLIRLFSPSTQRRRLPWIRQMAHWLHSSERRPCSAFFAKVNSVKAG